MVALSRTCSALLGMILMHCCLCSLLIPKLNSAAWGGSTSESFGNSIFNATSPAAATFLPLFALAGAGAFVVAHNVLAESPESEVPPSPKSRAAARPEAEARARAQARAC
ncbi:unnamed protein product [Polarella glacialis]|uniref:Uncharacterized protein n=1 Tax=Polarella glacialis TaxID=89957 RepID=A0A813G9J5_POLGL|nr:unnamed protein product [Polarella glacialis]